MIHNFLEKETLSKFIVHALHSLGFHEANPAVFVFLLAEKEMRIRRDHGLLQSI